MFIRAARIFEDKARATGCFQVFRRLSVTQIIRATSARPLFAFLVTCGAMVGSGAALAADGLSPVYAQVLASTSDTEQWGQMFGPVLRALENTMAELSAISDTVEQWAGSIGFTKDGVVSELTRLLSKVGDQVSVLWQHVEKNLLPATKT